MVYVVVETIEKKGKRVETVHSYWSSDVGDQVRAQKAKEARQAEQRAAESSTTESKTLPKRRYMEESRLHEFSKADNNRREFFKSNPADEHVRRRAITEGWDSRRREVMMRAARSTKFFGWTTEADKYEFLKDMYGDRLSEIIKETPEEIERKIAEKRPLPLQEIEKISVRRTKLPPKDD